jgi:UDP-N-acetyl-D-mannosaminuronate dehydrogenase
VDRLASYFCDSKAEKLRRLAELRIRRVAAGRDCERIAPGLSLARVAGSERVDLGGSVFSLEVEGASTFTTTTGVVVHNCIPLDPFYLSWKAREYGVTPKFIELAGDVNVAMPGYVVEKLQLALNERGKAVKGSRVLILGLAYKKDIDDARESPAYEIMGLLHALGAEVTYHDPHILEIGTTRRHPDKRGLRSVALTPENLGAQDAVLLVTDHSAVDYAMVGQYAQLIIDTRGVYRHDHDGTNVVQS